MTVKLKDWNWTKTQYTRPHKKWKKTRIKQQQQQQTTTTANNNKQQEKTASDTTENGQRKPRGNNFGN